MQSRITGAMKMSESTIVLLLLYATPTLVAWYRKHPQLFPILIINLLLGWTLVGWAVALAWSVMTFAQAQRQ
jgi:hypothetical protein